MRHRTRVKQTTTLDERLAKHALRLRAEARTLPRVERERALKKARQFDTAIYINDCLMSPAMRRPTPPPSADRPRD